jgi:hypothetical protein
LDKHLDNQSFTYPGWQNDAKDAEDKHIMFPILFAGKLAAMKKEQKMHVGDRSHSDLRQSLSRSRSYFMLLFHTFRHRRTGRSKD